MVFNLLRVVTLKALQALICYTSSKILAKFCNLKPSNMKFFINKFFNKPSKRRIRDKIYGNQPLANKVEDEQMDQILSTLSEQTDLADQVMMTLEAYNEDTPTFQLLDPTSSGIATFPEVTETRSIFTLTQTRVSIRKLALLPITAAACFLLLLLAHMFHAEKPASTTKPLISLHDVSGEVSLTRHDGTGLEKHTGKIDLPSSTIIQTGHNGTLTLVFEDTLGDTSVIIYPETQIRLLSSEPAKTWHLDYGIVKAKVAKQEQPFKIHSAHSTATVLGTEFEYSSNWAESRLHVLEGRVRLESTNREAVLVTAGQIGKALNKDQDHLLSVINDTPIKAPSIHSIGLEYSNTDTVNPKQYTRLDDGHSISLSANTQTPIALKIELEHSTSSRINVKLQNHKGQAILAKQLETVAQQKNSSDLRIELPNIKELSNGFLTLILKAENTDTDFETSQPIERQLSFRLMVI